MRRPTLSPRAPRTLVGVAAFVVLIAVACTGGTQPAAQPAAPAPAPAAVPAQPAKPAAEPAKPAPPAAQQAKPAAQPAKPQAAGDEPDAALVAAAKKDGKLVWYTSLELTQAKKLGDMFEKKYGVQVEVVRNGSERIFAQFMKEQSSNVYKADVIHTSDASNYLTMRADGLIAPYRPKAADAFAGQLKAHTMDAESYWFALRLSPFSVIYNTTKVKEADAPKAWKDLIDPKWKGKLAQAHPGYSGFVLTSIFLLEPVLGPDYYKQLAKNEPLVVQSAIDVTTKVASGEREVGAGTVHYTAWDTMRKGNPIKIVYPAEGTPLIVSPQALIKSAPHPSAGKLFIEYSLSHEAQQYLASDAGVHSARGDVTLPEGQVDLSKIKLLLADPAAVEKARDGVQKMFKDLFGV